MDKVNRGRFLKAGTATGAAAFIGMPALPTLSEHDVRPSRRPAR